METTSVKEYLAKQRKKVELPSGFVFEIRKMPPMIYAKMRELVGVTANDTEEETEEKVQGSLQEVMELVIPQCVVEPKIVIGDAGEDELSMDDLEMNDFLALLEEISEFSGISRESIEQRESFREE